MVLYKKYCPVLYFTLTVGIKYNFAQISKEAKDAAVKMKNIVAEEILQTLSLPRRASNFSLFNKFDQNQSFTPVSAFHNREQQNSPSTLFIWL